MPRVGDLFPGASGRSSLGVDSGPNLGAFDISSLAPFGHIIGLSGVYADPTLGQSGVLRYTRAGPYFEVSVDGGWTFDTLASSGQIQESINQNPFTDNDSINNAYEGGNEFYSNRIKVSSFGNAMVGILASEYDNLDTGPIGGGDDYRAVFSDQGFTTERPATYGFAVSGYSDVLDRGAGSYVGSFHDSYAYSQLGPNMLYIQGSGTFEGPEVEGGEILISEPPKLWIGVSGTLFSTTSTAIGSTVVSLRAEPSLHVWTPTETVFRSGFDFEAYAANSIVLDSDNTLALNGDTSIALTAPTITASATTSLIFGSTAGAATISAETTTTIYGDDGVDIITGQDIFGVNAEEGDDINISSARQLTLSVFSNTPASFNGSGLLRYEFGPNEAWHWSPSHTSDFFPIPHSGQVEEMIRGNVQPFQSGIHALGGSPFQINLTTSPPLPDTVTPYGQVHQLSGVFWDSKHGAKTFVRYNRNSEAFGGSGTLEFSTNNGANFEPLGSFTQSIPGLFTAGITLGGVARPIVQTVNINSRFMVPSGMKMVILACEGNADLTSQTAGTWTLDYGITEYATNESTPGGTTFHNFVSSVAPPSIHHAYAEGTISKPLLTLSGGQTWSPTIRNNGSSPGAISAGPVKSIVITYRYIKDRSSSIVR